ncbi:MAG: hypothetical protein R3B47_18040 [Bacteroidia bacterium]
MLYLFIFTNHARHQLHPPRYRQSDLPPVRSASDFADGDFWRVFYGKTQQAQGEAFCPSERIQYVQELYLVSYRYEMILLGVPPKFDRKQDELADLKKLKTRLQDSIAADSGRIFKILEQESRFNAQFHFWTQREDSLRNAVKGIKKKKRKSEAFALWRAAQDSLESVLQRRQNHQKKAGGFWQTH